MLVVLSLISKWEERCVVCTGNCGGSLLELPTKLHEVFTVPGEGVQKNGNWDAKMIITKGSLVSIDPKSCLSVMIFALASAYCVAQCHNTLSAKIRPQQRPSPGTVKSLQRFAASSNRYWAQYNCMYTGEIDQHCLSVNIPDNTSLLLTQPHLGLGPG